MAVLGLDFGLPIHPEKLMLSLIRSLQEAAGLPALVSRLLSVVFAGFLSIAIVSCGGKEEPEPIPEEPEVEEEPEEVVEEEEPEPVVIERLAPGECIPNCNIPREALDDPSGNLVDRTINFEFDRAELNEQDKDTLRYHAEYLTSWADVAVTVNGHADERGSREYNLALGYRRSNSAKSFLISLGVGGNQLKVKSSGEDDPLIPESNEYAWGQNRRAVLEY